MPYILSIEGNIGSGKSTILNYLKENNENKDIIFLKEPVHIWETIKDEENKTIIENFYQDAKKYGFMFQIMAFATRMQILKDTIKENPNCKIIVCERSILADQHVFASMLHDDNIIDTMGFTIYQMMANNYMKDYPLNGIIYIDAEPNICMERIEQRNREGESNIELSYLGKCKHYHDTWLDSTFKYLTSFNENKEIYYSSSTKCYLFHLKTNKQAKFERNNPDDVANEWYQKLTEFINIFL